jgi:UDP-N-acetylglucosamine 4,6-dehydratase
MIDFLTDKSVLVTGGTGSFGRNFIKHLLKHSAARKIVVFSRDEFKQYQMQHELNDKRLRFFIGDVRDRDRLNRAFKNIDIVVHAAALKQVPALEYNPFEAVKTNILGTQNVCDAAIDQSVKKVLLISTDKAVHPINLYGSTKLCAEKLVINSNFYSPDGTRFSVVRYGNVIGSRGSIVETLIRQKQVNKVYITDVEMTRFWISLQESFDLVTFALGNMEGGEIFVPKIPSMKLVDLFDVLAPSAEKEIIGIRPGEKLHEILLHERESERAIELENYFVVLPEYPISCNDNYEKYYSMGKKTNNAFRYTSDTNTQWIDNNKFKAITEELKRSFKN